MGIATALIVGVLAQLGAPAAIGGVLSVVLNSPFLGPALKVLKVVGKDRSLTEAEKPFVARQHAETRFDPFGW